MKFEISLTAQIKTIGKEDTEEDLLEIIFDALEDHPEIRSFKIINYELHE